jgi:hypothetical protein
VEGILGVLTGALAIVTPVAIVLIICGFRHLRYVQRQRTIRMALEKGLDPSPLLAEAVAQPADSRKYLLRGLLWGLPGIVIGLGVTWAAIEHGTRDLTIIGWIPAAIGAAYLIFYRWVASHGNDTANAGGPLPPGSRTSDVASANSSGTD